jgi:hypothetical protein
MSGTESEDRQSASDELKTRLKALETELKIK